MAVVSLSPRYLSNGVGDARCYNKAASDAVDPSQVRGANLRDAHLEQLR